MKAYQFPVVLEKLLDEAVISQRELARRCDLSASNITQIMDGQRCTPEVLGSILTEMGKATKVANHRYMLLCAHLHDEVVRTGLNPAMLSVTLGDGTGLATLDISAELRLQLELLARESMTNPELAGLIADFAGMISRHKAQLAEARGEVHQFPTPAKKLPRGRSQETAG